MCKCQSECSVDRTVNGPVLSLYHLWFTLSHIIYDYLHSVIL